MRVGLGKLGRVAGDGQGVQVDHAVVGVVAVLEVDPPAQRPEVVAQVHGPGGLDPGKHCFGFPGFGFPGFGFPASG